VSKKDGLRLGRSPAVPITYAGGRLLARPTVRHVAWELQRCPSQGVPVNRWCDTMNVCFGRG